MPDAEKANLAAEKEERRGGDRRKKTDVVHGGKEEEERREEREWRKGKVKKCGHIAGRRRRETSPSTKCGFSQPSIFVFLFSFFF